MKFVQDFLHPRHITQAPHKWFLAVLASPIHAGQIHYKKRYHLRYNHAKKLFVIDVFLVLAALLLFAATLWWQLYDPTITSDVTITLQGPNERIRSGEDITLYATYANNSDITLYDVSLTFTLPEFASVKSIASEGTQTADNHITLANLLPDDKGIIAVTFEYITSPGSHDDVVAALSYRQQHRNQQERVISRRTLLASDSTIKADPLAVPTQLAKNSEIPMVVVVRNTGDAARRVSIAPDVAPDITFTPDVAEPYDVASSGSQEIPGTLTIGNIPSGEVELHISPLVYVGQTTLRQHSTATNTTIVAPQVNISSNWATDDRALAPGQSANLNITLQNTGDVSVQDMQITLPFPASRVSSAAMRPYGIVGQGVVTITSDYDAGLLSLAPGNSHTVTIPIRVLADARADALRALELAPQVQASIAQTSQTITDTTLAPSISLGGSVNARARSWYYTPEGDQLGRGPLPPRASEETTYWVSVTVQNGSSNLENVHIRGTLPSNVRFTGKTSVTAGSDITFNEETRSWSYSLARLSTGDTVGMHMELGVTPSLNDIGNHLPLTTDILLRAQDSFIEEPITEVLPNVTTELIGDARAAARGTQVVQ